MKYTCPAGICFSSIAPVTGCDHDRRGVRTPSRGMRGHATARGPRPAPAKGEALIGIASILRDALAAQGIAPRAARGTAGRVSEVVLVLAEPTAEDERHARYRRQEAASERRKRMDAARREGEDLAGLYFATRVQPNADYMAAAACGR